MPVQLSIKTKGAELVRKGLADLGAEIPKIARKDIYDALMRVRSRLASPAPRPTYPINWDSPKQQRAYFATDGFGRGIPTKRTGRYQKAWAVVRLAAGYRIENPIPAAGYIGGDYSGQGQSQIHAGRWPLFMVEIENEIMELPPAIESHISYYARGRGLLAG
jgi:hypothetical protein